MRCISLKVFVVSMLFNLLVMPFGTTLAVVCGYVSLLASILFPVELMHYNRGCINKKQFRIILIFAMIACVNSYMSLTAISMKELENVIKALISFFTFLISIAAKDIFYTDRDLKFYFSVIRIFAVVIILYTLIPFGFQYTIINTYGEKIFTMSMGNPNATATKIMFAIMLLCIETRISQNNYLRACNVALIGGLIYTVIKLQSRTVFLCIVVYVIYCVLLRFPIKKWMTIWIWIVPVIFIPIQLMLPRFPLWDFFDKTLTTGREILFADFLKLITSSPLQVVFGDFAEYQLGNSHNIIFSMIFNFGFVGLILFFVFWIIESCDAEGAMNKVTQSAWIGWIVFVIHSMAEAAALSGAFTFGAIIIVINRLTKDQMIVCQDSELKFDLPLADRRKKEGE